MTTPYAARRDALRRLIIDADLDALLVTGMVNVRYLTGFTGSTAEVLVPTSGPARFATDGRYTDQAAAQVPDLDRVTLPSASWIAEGLDGCPRLGVESHLVPWDRVRVLDTMLPGEQIVPAGALVECLRTVKDPAEVAQLGSACAIADRAFAAMLSWLRPGCSEREVRTRLDRSMIDLGADERSFDTIVASGPNAAVPHHRPSTRVLEAGDVVKFDFGAQVGGYHSDMTRMVALGEPDPQLRRVFDAVRTAQEAGLAVVRDGAETAAVDAACREALTQAGFGERFVHGTGHGVGLEVHEDPYLRPAPGTPREAEVASSPSVTLRERMAVTVEPGVYLPGLGGVRIEDSVVVTTAGADVLTTTPKDLVVL